MIADPSAGGASIDAPQAVGNPDDTLTLEFGLPTGGGDTELKLSAKTRNLFTGPALPGKTASIRHGLEFAGVPLNELMLLENFVFRLLLEDPQPPDPARSSSIASP